MNLQNNSKEMKTVVETFVIEETAELIYDNEKLDKWNELVSELGLKGQTEIIKPQKSPIPFMHLKTSLMNVFDVLCPRRVDAEKYNISPIPVEILELIALSRREQYFENIEIWYDEKSPDPVCIGTKPTSYYSRDSKGRLDVSFNSKQEAIDHAKEIGGQEYEPYPMGITYYLLGKWADVKHSFEELKELASKRFMAEEGNRLRKEIRDNERKLSDLETGAFDKFN